MNKTLFLGFLILLFFSILYAEPAYNLNLIIYKNDSVDLLSIGIRNGTGAEFPTSLNSNYRFDIIDKDGSLLFTQPFTMSFKVYPEPREYESGPQEIEIDKTEDIWGLPYFEDAKLIQLYHEDKKIWEYNVEYLREQVPKESPPPLKKEPSPQTMNFMGYLPYVFLGMAVILAILYFVLFRKKPSAGAK